MKRCSVLLLVTCFLAATPALADNVSPVRAHKSLTRFGSAGSKDERDSIHGHCTVLEGNGNPFSSSCVNLMLTLTAKDGGDEIQARTDENGNFAFGVDKARFYKIKSGSKSYELVTPKRLLKGGDSFEVRLKQL